MRALLVGRPQIVRVLITGFEPFNGHHVNSSWEVARSLALDPPPGVDIVLLRLPVREQQAAGLVLPVIDQGSFDAWLGLGEADGRRRLSIESRAINAFGVARKPIITGGRATYQSGLRIFKIATRLDGLGVPAKISTDDGDYVCNALSYLVYRHVTLTGSDIVTGFIHLRYLPQQTEPRRGSAASLSLKLQARGIRAVVESIRDNVLADSLP